jgi:hypothetical protein
MPAKNDGPGFCSVHRRSLLLGGGERPNTGLADNSSSACRKINPWQILIIVVLSGRLAIFSMIFIKMS